MEWHPKAFHYIKRVSVGGGTILKFKVVVEAFETLTQSLVGLWVGTRAWIFQCLSMPIKNTTAFIREWIKPLNFIGELTAIRQGHDLHEALSAIDRSPEWWNWWW